MIYDLFSRRGKALQPEIYKYEDMPIALKNQIIHIWNDAIGEYISYSGTALSNKVWNIIHDTLCREYGVFELHRNGYNNQDKCEFYLEEEKSIDKILDIVELSFRAINGPIRKKEYGWSESQRELAPDAAITELNERFKMHGLGFEFTNNQIIRIDSKYIHKEAVVPALHLLYEEDFKGASDEFLTAHNHYLEGKNKEAVTEALKAFESVMKTICKRMKWDVNERATAAPLIKALFENELIPNSFQSQLSSLKVTLEGLATVRNRNTGHGQGEDKIEIPSYLVSYSLHLCATNIVFLVEAYKSLKEN